MRIALDYDETYTRDPAFWDAFIDFAKRSGHEVVCVTLRYESERPPDIPCPCICTGRKAKRNFTKDKPIDVWIDDDPWHVYYPASDYLEGQSS